MDEDYGEEGEFADAGDAVAGDVDEEAEAMGGGELVATVVQRNLRSDTQILLAALGARMLPDCVDLPNVREQAGACTKRLLAKWKEERRTTAHLALNQRDREADKRAVANAPRTGVKRPFSAVARD